MKKKVLFFVLSAIMLAFLVGCGGSGNGSSSTAASSDQDVGSTNLAPVADAGDDKTVRPDDLVNLDGTASSDSDENYPLSYTWQIITQPAGSSANLSDADTSTPSFTLDMNGDYTIQLVVTDALGAESEPDTVIISTVNSKPVANAGDDQFLDTGPSTIQLDGSQSFDPDDDPITYEWTITSKPDGSFATLSDSTTPDPTFDADILGTYIIQLVVVDSFGLVSEADEIVVTSENVKPVADAEGNQVVLVGDTVFLDGSGSYDANGNDLTYSWSLVDKPEGSSAELSFPAAVDPIFVADIEGIYTVSLVVNDGIVDSDPSNVTILAIDAEKIDDFIDPLMRAIIELNGLDDGDFKHLSDRDVLTQKIIVVLLNYLKGNIDQSMLDKLTEDIGGKMDGCAEKGDVDANDWIINCPAQDKVYPYIQEAIAALEVVLGL
ncbi:MAG: PKD domain-containing protein [Deltaproteobacteria bacterium]|nr:PKD domain-containing protein [Deltaproteobacteria bacterium]MDH3963651.1 PKD domain-containing protein [Deltaproteobacteria bacterium]